MLLQLQKEYQDQVSDKNELELAFKTKCFEWMWFFTLPKAFSEKFVDALSAKEKERLRETCWQEVNETFHSRIGYPGSESYFFEGEKSDELLRLLGNSTRIKTDIEVNYFLIYLLTFLCLILCLHQFF